jgi:hypothetical protein
MQVGRTVIRLAKRRFRRGHPRLISLFENSRNWKFLQEPWQVNIEIMRTFVRLRQILAANAQLARKLDTLFKVLFDASRALMAPPVPKKRKIGFLAKE